MTEHQLLLVRYLNTDMYVARCKAGDFESEPGSPAVVGKNYYEHVEKTKGQTDERLDENTD